MIAKTPMWGESVHSEKNRFRAATVSKPDCPHRMRETIDKTSAQKLKLVRLKQSIDCRSVIPEA